MRIRGRLLERRVDRQKQVDASTAKGPQRVSTGKEAANLLSKGKIPTSDVYPDSPKNAIGEGDGY